MGYYISLEHISLSLELDELSQLAFFTPRHACEYEMQKASDVVAIYQSMLTFYSFLLES